MSIARVTKSFKIAFVIICHISEFFFVFNVRFHVILLFPLHLFEYLHSSVVENPNQLKLVFLFCLSFFLFVETLFV